ncbi:MAG TPA: M3 family metallopeptidase [Terriglobales bacterium]
MSITLRRLVSAAFVSLLAVPFALSQTSPIGASIWASKPDVAAFEKVENDHLAAAQAAIDKLTAVKGPRTVENTLMPYDEAVRQIDCTAYFAGLMEQTHPDSAFRDHATTMVQKASAAQTALSLNQNVYKALEALDLSKADAATRYYVKRTLLLFRLAGVDKDEATRGQLKKLNDELAAETSMYDRNIADDQKTVKADPADLDGLPQDYIDRHKPGADGKVTIATTYPDVFPVFKFAKSDDLRKRMNEAFDTRGYPANHDLLLKILKTRYDIASLLGYSSWADYNAADKMIAKGQNIAKFISDLEAAARPIAERETKVLLAEKQKAHPGATEIYDYESGYLAELVRRSQYDFDSQSVRPYLPYQSVKKGIMDTAAALFHVTFRQESDAPAWAPTVETWDVLDQDQMIGRFYLDMHPRPGKYTHANMVPVLDGIRGKQLPEAALVCNFAEPTADDPGLMESGDVITFFHEFGHLMHHILGGNQQWAGISGITMEADFGEAPSQMLEEFMRSPQVLASFARHYKTGEPIPADLVARMNRASAFGRGNYTAAQLSYTAISYDIYKGKPDGIDLDAVCVNDEKQYTMIVPSPDLHMYASFGHLASYSSAYYTYMWDLVIAQDFFQQFDHNNMLAGEAPMRYRRVVLEPGGSMSANDLVKNFLGRPQNMTAIEHWMGEEFAAGSAGKPAAN